MIKDKTIKKTEPLETIELDLADFLLVYMTTKEMIRNLQGFCKNLKKAIKE